MIPPNIKALYYYFLDAKPDAFINSYIRDIYDPFSIFASTNKEILSYLVKRQGATITELFNPIFTHNWYKSYSYHERK